MNERTGSSARAAWAWLRRWRYLKFGMVGALGTAVNLGTLWLGQELLFTAIDPASTRLNYSLSAAIGVATLHNFTLNRVWTWHDRARLPGRSLPGEFVRYAFACWLGSALQFVLTKWLALYLNYLVANLAAIVCVSACNFLLNDAWTFAGRRRNGDARPHSPHNSPHNSLPSLASPPSVPSVQSVHSPQSPQSPHSTHPTVVRGVP